MRGVCLWTHPLNHHYYEDPEVQGEKSPLPYHFVPTWGLQEEAGRLGELAVFRVPKGVDGSGAEAVVSAGCWLEGDVDWLVMGSDWKSGLCGERCRGEQICCRDWSEQPGWGGLGRRDTAMFPTYSSPALKFEH